MTTLANINFEDVALAAVRKYGFSIIPRARGKEPLEINGRKVGAFARTNTEEGVRAFAAQVPSDSNYSICSDENFYILTKEQEDQSVRDAVRNVLALRALTKSVNMRTTHSQTAILKALTPSALARAAVILEAAEEATR